MSIKESILNTQGLVAFWDFQEPSGTKRIDLGPKRYALLDANGNVERMEEGFFGPYSAKMTEGSYFRIPRQECGDLNIYGENAQITVMAWVNRGIKAVNECEAVAGIWNEEDRKRQYCLFLNLKIHNSSQQVCGHVSSVGGPTPGQRWCMDSSIGSQAVPYGKWQCIGFSYDGTFARSYLNGHLDTREVFNPYRYEEGIYDGGENGSDFTVGSVFRSGEMGNWYVGLLGGLAVFNRVLSDAEILQIGEVS